MTRLASLLTLILLLPPAPAGAQLAAPNAAGVSLGHLHYVVRDVEAHPGMNINFLDVEEKAVPTKGRMLDHIGFEVRSLEAFCLTLEASGVTFERPYRRNPGDPVATALLIDPWGTSIELTEGLSRY